MERTRSNKPLAAFSGTWEANGTRMCLTFAHDPHGGWNVLWPDGHLMLRAYVPNLRTAGTDPGQVHLQTLAGKGLSRQSPDREAIAMILLEVLPELARLESKDRPVRELAELGL
jgi:prepilin-type processing-associated H-X9-DG protein